MKRLVAPLLAALWFLTAGVLLYVASLEAQPRHVIPSSTFAGLPAAGSIGSVANVTDSNPGVYLDNGSAHVLVASSTGNPVFLSGTSFAGTLDHSNTASRTWTLQDSTDTLVGRATTDTLTNKTITAPVLSGTATGTYTLGGTPTIANITLSGTSTFTGTATSTKACATGYTRVFPNYCKRNVAFQIAFTTGTACTATGTGDGLPADAKYLHIVVNWLHNSNNAIATRLNEITFYHDTTCTNAASSYRFADREEVAVTAGTDMGEGEFMALVPVTEADSFRRTVLNVNSGGNGTLSFFHWHNLGYFD